MNDEVQTDAGLMLVGQSFEWSRQHLGRLEIARRVRDAVLKIEMQAATPDGQRAQRIEVAARNLLTCGGADTFTPAADIAWSELYAAVFDATEAES